MDPMYICSTCGCKYGADAVYDQGNGTVICHGCHAAPPVSQVSGHYACAACNGLFTTNAMYDLGGAYICRECHAQTAPAAEHDELAALAAARPRRRRFRRKNNQSIVAPVVVGIGLLGVVGGGAYWAWNHLQTPTNVQPVEAGPVAVVNPPAATPVARPVAPATSPPAAAAVAPPTDPDASFAKFAADFMKRAREGYVADSIAYNTFRWTDRDSYSVEVQADVAPITATLRGKLFAAHHDPAPLHPSSVFEEPKFLDAVRYKAVFAWEEGRWAFKSLNAVNEASLDTKPTEILRGIMENAYKSMTP